ncbi:ATP-binding cassette domain-containing protein [Leptospira harrisiae]|uniref:ABC transporter ATP-binding protein n=1 Tax=Leptospira harrisiae TaxID=2023189 RepID=A0A2N0AN58_9LEPT|nr:ATP-binding cassette domain-containing protein [Leptospira harrisiae]PJZ85690.1 ABC transporter ATP-binding protein [Leptospira harrisiae]PKA09226.1 ABC transporter ATP-binding protein [Leptospira harrisiae]
MSDHITIHNLNFQFESQQEPLFQNLNLHFSKGWTGIVGKNGSGKSTLAKLISGEILPDKGSVQGNDFLFSISQGTELADVELTDFIYDDSNNTGFWKSLLEIKIQSEEGYEFLSFGEKRRILLAMALSKNVDVLILDEPTNHLDTKSSQIIRNAILHFQGIGILICHDRSLLDEVTTSCVFLEKNFISHRPGNYSAGKMQMQREAEERIHDWEMARTEHKKLEAELNRRREEARLSHTHRSKKGLDLHDHDGRQKKNLARVTGKDGQAGRLKNQIERRTENSKLKEKQIWEKLPEKENLGILWNGVPSKRSTLFMFDEESLTLEFLSLSLSSHLKILPDSKIAITGPNGAGKSTLLRYLLQSFQEKGIPYLYLPQEFSKNELADLLWEFQNLPNEKKAKVLSGIHRLGSDPKRFSESEALSPGEGKKLFLSLHLEKSPEVIVLDEPTNHLDLQSLEAIESSLATLGTALIFVSHDRRFVETLAKEEWCLENLSLVQKHLDRI